MKSELYGDEFVKYLNKAQIKAIEKMVSEKVSSASIWRGIKERKPELFKDTDYNIKVTFGISMGIVTLTEAYSSSVSDIIGDDRIVNEISEEESKSNEGQEDEIEEKKGKKEKKEKKEKNRFMKLIGKVGEYSKSLPSFIIDHFSGNEMTISVGWEPKFFSQFGLNLGFTINIDITKTAKDDGKKRSTND